MDRGLLRTGLPGKVPTHCQGLFLVKENRTLRSKLDKHTKGVEDVGGIIVENPGNLELCLLSPVPSDPIQQ